MERVYRIPASQFRMWKPGIEDRAMRTNFWEIIRDFSKDYFTDELSWAKNINVLDAIKYSVKDVPKDYAHWFSKIIYLRFEALIMQNDYDKAWENASNLFS